MVKLENISLPYYGEIRRLSKGDVFEATPQHATLLVMIGKCRRYEEAIAKPEVVTGADLDMQEAVEISPRTGKPKRTYKRKDMVAE
jgi:hypothetical protein